MDGISNFFILLIPLLQETSTHAVGSKQCANSNPFLSKEEATSFIRIGAVRLSRPKRAWANHCTANYRFKPVNCGVEASCECHKSDCVIESQREKYCAPRNCEQERHGTFCFLSTPCPGHHDTKCTDTCKELYPPEGEVVFVVDASLSTGQVGFDRQKTFMTDFLKRFPIGPTDFQVAIVSFSLNATIHCHLNTHPSESSLVREVDNLSYVGDGPSYTGTALKLIQDDVFKVGNGVRTNRTRYVIVLTDGLSSNVMDTENQARALKADPLVEIKAVAFGSQVNHLELLAMASERVGVPQVYTSILPDALFSVLKRHMPNCPDCSRNSSDVILLLDASRQHSKIQAAKAVYAIRTFVGSIQLGPNHTHLGYIKYGQHVNEEFDFTFRQTIDSVSNYVGLHTDPIPGPARLHMALDYLTQHAFQSVKGARSDARKFVVLFTHRIDSGDMAAAKSSAEALKRSGVTLAVVGIEYRQIVKLLELASDPGLVFVVGENGYAPASVLLAMAASLEFDVCK